MTSTALANYIIGFIMTITILTVSGNFDEAIATNTGQPYLAVIYAATGSYTATVVFMIIIIILFFFCTINCITTTSRQLWAFARDGGMPFSPWLSKVRPRATDCTERIRAYCNQVNHKNGLPVNSLRATFGVTFCLSWIAAGSTIAFNNIISISLVGLLLSYGSTILTIAIRRASPEPLPPSYLKFSKPLGFLINGIALCFVVIAFVMVFFPTAPNPDGASMNWSIVISGGVILFAGFFYVVKGKHSYIAPATRMRKFDNEHDVIPLAITTGSQKA